jgi:anti-anti-sigma factor
MDITSETDGDLVQFHLAGHMDTTTSHSVTQAVNAAMAAGGRRVVFDMRDVSYVSSAGLRVILVAAKQARAVGGGAAVFGLQPRVEKIFSVSGFDKVVPVAISVEEARERLPATKG